MLLYCTVHKGPVTYRQAAHSAPKLDTHLRALCKLAHFGHLRAYIQICALLEHQHGSLLSCKPAGCVHAIPLYFLAFARALIAVFQ